MNKEARPLTQEQRKEFVQLLKDSKTRIIDSLRDNHSKRYQTAWRAAVAILMKQWGAEKVFEEATAAKKKLKASEKDLKALGFRFGDDGELELTSEGSAQHGDELRQNTLAFMDTELELARRKYEVAILNVLATESVEEAKGIVEPLV